MVGPGGRCDTTALRWVLAGLLLLVGGFGVAVDHLPPTVWAAPVGAGPLVGDQVIWSVQRRPTEVRLEVGTDADRRPVLLTADGDGGAVGRVRVALPEGLDAGAGEAIRSAVAEHEARWPERPAYVVPRGVRVTTMQAVEEALLQVLVLGWLAAMILTWERWWPTVRPRGSGIWFGSMLLLLATLPGLLSVRMFGGVWHSNLHGFERWAAVLHHTPPSAAGLGLLHGSGWYVVVQGLDAATGGWFDPFELTALLTVAWMLATYAWLSALWQSESAGLVGVAWLALAPAVVRLAGSVTMYVPAALAATLALWWFERHLRDDDALSFGMALPPMLVAMQTRAELAVLLPVWVLLSMLLRKPGWLLEAWRRPWVWAGVGCAALALLPRLASLSASPPPQELRRFAIEASDPRVWRVLIPGLAALVWAAIPVRVSTRRRLAWTALAVSPVAVAVVVLAWPVWSTTGPLEPTSVVHPMLDAPSWLFGRAALVGVTVTGLLSAPRRVGWLVAAGCGALWLYMPQYDSLSSYVRTSLIPSMFMVAVVGGAAVWIRPLAPAIEVVALMQLPWVMPWVSHRYPTQVLGELVAEARALPEGTQVLWLSTDDLPAEVRAGDVHDPRLDLAALLPPSLVARPLHELEDAVASGAPVVFLRTPDCERPLLRARDHSAWIAGAWVPWHQVDASDVSDRPRIAIDVAPGTSDPLCAAAEAWVVGTLDERWVAPRNAGSIYETLTVPPDGTLRLGLYRVQGRQLP